MSATERPIGPDGVRSRAQQARDYLAIAELAIDAGDLIAGPNVAAANAVLAGIAASDAITGHVLGVHSTGENHAAAVSVLQRAHSPGAKHLQRLLGAKPQAQYGADILGAGKARELVTSARRLIETMNEVLAR